MNYILFLSVFIIICGCTSNEDRGRDPTLQFTYLHPLFGERGRLVDHDEWKIPAFPIRWKGHGLFGQVLGDDSNYGTASYIHDNIKRRGRETIQYATHEDTIYFDFRPDGALPATEVFIRRNLTSGRDDCIIPPFPIPELFDRKFWVEDTQLRHLGLFNITFTGLVSETGGVLSRCWKGWRREGYPILFCNLGSHDDITAFQPTVKQIHSFRFIETYGEVQDESFGGTAPGIYTPPDNLNCHY